MKRPSNVGLGVSRAVRGRRKLASSFEGTPDNNLDCHSE